jgi:hypothetical protein
MALAPRGLSPRGLLSDLDALPESLTGPVLVPSTVYL